MRYQVIDLKTDTVYFESSSKYDCIEYVELFVPHNRLIMIMELIDEISLGTPAHDTNNRVI